MSLLPQRWRVVVVGGYGFFSTWLKFTEGLLPAYFCTCGILRESLEGKILPTAHFYIQRSCMTYINIHD